MAAAPAMQSLLHQIQDLTTRGNFAQLQNTLKAAEAGLQQTAQQQGPGVIQQALQQLDPLMHTFGCIALLCACPYPLVPPGLHSEQTHANQVCLSCILLCSAVVQELVGRPGARRAGQCRFHQKRVVRVHGGRCPPYAAVAVSKCVQPHTQPRLSVEKLYMQRTQMLPTCGERPSCTGSASKCAAQEDFMLPAAATLAGHLRDHVVAMQTPQHGILPLTAAVQKAAPSPEYITPMHAMLFQWCVPGRLALV